MKPQICRSQNYNHQFRPRFIPGFASFFPLIWVYLKIRYTPKNSDRNGCFSTKHNGTRFSRSFRFLRQGTFCNKKNAIFPMCNKLPIIQSNLPLGLIHSPHVPSNVGIHQRFWPCFNRKIHWKGVSTIRFSQKCDIFGWSQSTMKIYYININLRSSL